jgi:outer membrane protein assembly factor BamB
MNFNLSRLIFLFVIFSIGFAFTATNSNFSSPAFSLDTISKSKFKFEKQLSLSDSLVLDSLISDSSVVKEIYFPESFSNIEGVSTFRGGPRRDRPSYGIIEERPKSLKIKWSYSTGGDAKWGGGAGWTGQPCIIKWSDSVKNLMNIAPALKLDSAFKEVILGSLDGKIYFLDLNSGKPSRPVINIRNPIKGTVSVDPRGWPLLYAGQGISNTGEFGVRIFNLIDQSRIFFVNGRDPFAYRAWAAFDGAPLYAEGKDILFLGGENGVVYSVQLNSNLSFPDSSLISNLTILPKVDKYRYQFNTSQYQGIENSLVGYRDQLYFSDNNGFIQCLSANTLDPVWIARNYDDTDATLVLEEEDSIPFLYTGNEVDLQGAKGFTYIKKLNGIDGSTVWEAKYACLTIRGDHPVNGGMLSTPVIGKQNGRDLAIFSLSRYGGMNKGLLVALKKSSGEKAWEVMLDNYAWSSPLDIYDKHGNMYIFLADSKGFVMLFDGLTGELIYKAKIAELFEASPAAFNNMIVIASRPREIFCLEVE